MNKSHKIARLLLNDLCEFEGLGFAVSVEQAGNEIPEDAIRRNVLVASETLGRVDVPLRSRAEHHAGQGSSGIPLSHKIPGGKVLLKSEVKEVIASIAMLNACI